TASRCLLKLLTPTVKSDASLLKQNGRRCPRTSRHFREIGLARKPARRSRLLLTLESCSSNSVRQRVCGCNPSIRTILTLKATLSGLHATEMERSMPCTSEHRECATCYSPA